MTGKIKTKTDKGFGFIAAEGSEKDVFFHSTSVQGTTYDDLQEGDSVTFETEESDRGPRAVNVQRA